MLAQLLHVLILGPLLATRSAALGVRRLRYQQSRDDGHRGNVVWISAFPRSGSSTLLSMVRAANPDSDVGDAVTSASDEVFTLFEPCHFGKDIEHSDILIAEGLPKPCPTLLSELARCNFSRAQTLWGWDNKHTTNHGQGYTPATAAAYCNRANLVAFKTVGQSKVVDATRRLSEILWTLEDVPALRILDVVRDPRAIYASWKATDPFPRILGERSYPLWREVCDTFASNLNVSHSRVHRVILEDFARDPRAGMRQVYSFLDLKFGIAQEQWLNATFFQGDGCRRENNYTDCHVQPLDSLTKWREELSNEELLAIGAYEPCRRVMTAYSYPLQ